MLKALWSTKTMNGSTSQSLSGTDSLTGNSVVQQAFNELLKNGLTFDLDLKQHKIVNGLTMGQDESISTIPNIDWVKSYFVSSGGGGQPVSLPTSLGQYQQVRPLDRDLDLTTSSNYDLLVKDSPVVPGSKKRSEWWSPISGKGLVIDCYQHSPRRTNCYYYRFDSRYQLAID